MSSSWSLLVILLLSFNLHSYGQDAPSDPLSSLVAVQVIFRHGARNIERTFPSDPYGDEEFWPNGFHQLTCLGKTQSYSLGRFLFQRYSSFINTTTYVRREVVTHSSDIDRTIQSASAVLAGLYPPNEVLEEEEDCTSIPWKDIPVHTIPFQIDNMIRQESPCPRYDELLNEVQTGPLVTDRIAVNMDTISKFMENVGISDIKNSYQLIYSYFDALIVERYHNLTLPTWANEILDSPGVRELALFYFQTLSYTDEMKRLRVGPLFHQVLHNFNLTLKGKVGDEIGRRLYLISGHDHTITGFLNTLNLYTENTRPTYSSALIVELHKEEDKIVVKLLYKNGNESALQPLTIQGCPSPCLYSDFAELISPYVIDYPTWCEECLLSSGEGGWSTIIRVTGWIVIISAFILILVTLILWICSTLKKRKVKTRYERYQ